MNEEQQPTVVVNNHPSPPEGPANEDVQAAIKQAENEAMRQMKFLAATHGMVLHKYNDGGLLILHPQYGHTVVPHVTWRQDLKLLERWMEEGLGRLRREALQAPKPWYNRRWGRWLLIGLIVAGALAGTAFLWLR